MWESAPTAVEEDEYGPSCLWLGLFGCEHTNVAPAEAEVFYPSDGERLGRTRDCLGVANGRVPW